MCAVMPGTNITSHGGNEKAWVWTAMDFADEEQKIEMLAIRLGSVESAPLKLQCHTTCLRWTDRRLHHPLRLQSDRPPNLVFVSACAYKRLVDDAQLAAFSAVTDFKFSMH